MQRSSGRRRSTGPGLRAVSMRRRPRRPPRPGRYAGGPWNGGGPALRSSSRPERSPATARCGGCCCVLSFAIVGLLLTRCRDQLRLAVSRSLPLAVLLLLPFASVLWSISGSISLRRAIALLASMALAYVLAIRFTPRQLADSGRGGARTLHAAEPRLRGGAAGPRLDAGRQAACAGSSATRTSSAGTPRSRSSPAPRSWRAAGAVARRCGGLTLRREPALPRRLRIDDRTALDVARPSASPRSTRF